MTREETKMPLWKRIVGVVGIIFIVFLLIYGLVDDSFTKTAILILAILRLALFVIPLFVKSEY